MKPSWRDYFMRSAYLIATRASCDRKHVGVLVVSPDNRVVASGYNGSPAGMPSCDEVGHEIADGHCVRTIHAEMNAINYAGTLARGCTLYTTIIPCYDCCKSIVNVGIKTVVYDEFYQSRYGKSNAVVPFLEAAGITVIQHDSVRLAMFKRALADLAKLEAEVLATQLVEYACGCTTTVLKADVLCPVHKVQRVHE